MAKVLIILCRCAFTAAVIVTMLGGSMIGADCWFQMTQQSVRLGVDNPWWTIASFIALVLTCPMLAAMWISAWVHSER